jgi:hypothetical protein
MKSRIVGRGSAESSPPGAFENEAAHAVKNVMHKSRNRCMQ